MIRPEASAPFGHSRGRCSHVVAVPGMDRPWQVSGLASIALCGLFENLPADQHAADFAGAGADLVELGVAQEPPTGEIVDIAVAAQTLDRLQRHPGRALGGVE